MSRSSSDSWFVRLPDARVLHANSTRSVRHHIEAGTIPKNSHARRSSRERWTALHRLEAFADLFPEAPRSRRNHSDYLAENEAPGRTGDTQWQLHAVGVRALVSELVSALDTTLTKRKLVVAGGAALVFGLLALAHDVALNQLAEPWHLYGALGQGILALVAAGFCTIFLTQLTFIELSQLRPATTRETLHNLSPNVLRLLTCYLVVVGGIVAVLYALQTVPGWPNGIESEGDLTGDQALVLAAVVVKILLEVVLLPLLGFSLLLGPIVVIEESSVARSLWQWLALIRNHMRRLFLYESLAAVVAVVAALPFAAPVCFALWNAPADGLPGLVARATLDVLFALAATPALAYLVVANVFIYLNLRYELPSAR